MGCIMEDLFGEGDPAEVAAYLEKELKIPHEFAQCFIGVCVGVCVCVCARVGVGVCSLETYPFAMGGSPD